MTLLDDALDEDDETFELVVRPEGETSGGSVGIGTIEDDDPSPALADSTTPGHRSRTAVSASRFDSLARVD